MVEFPVAEVVKRLSRQICTTRHHPSNNSSLFISRRGHAAKCEGLKAVNASLCSADNSVIKCLCTWLQLKRGA